MTYWLDAQLDPDLAAWLGSRFGVAKHLLEVGLNEANDETIYRAARTFKVTAIVTKDEDFVPLSARLGPPPQVILLKCGNLRTVAMQMFLSVSFAAALDEVQKGKAVVEILGP